MMKKTHLELLPSAFLGSAHDPVFPQLTQSPAYPQYTDIYVKHALFVSVDSCCLGHSKGARLAEFGG